MDSQREIDMTTLKMNKTQAKALEILNPEANEPLMIAMILTFGHVWRVIINEWIEQQQRIPTPEDLIWCSSLDNHLGRDIREIVTELKKQV